MLVDTLRPDRSHVYVTSAMYRPDRSLVCCCRTVSRGATVCRRLVRTAPSAVKSSPSGEEQGGWELV
jgi:hypothetical protein